MVRKSFLVLCTACSLVLTACGGGNNNNNNQQDAAPQEDRPPQFDRITADQPIQQDTAPQGDNNDSFEQAIEMDYTTANQKSGVVNPKGDEDFYKFTGQAGDWVAIFVSANPGCAKDKLDPVLTLYNASQQQIAFNDDELLGQVCDSFLLTRLPADGVYYVKIQDWFQYHSPNDPSQWEGGSLYTYKLYLMKLTHDPTNGIMIDPEQGDDQTQAPDLVFPQDAAGSLLGTLRDTSDKDVFAFTLANPSTVYVIFQPPGAEGNGSTTPFAMAYITTKAAPTVAVARIEGTNEQFELQPPLLPAGEYYLWITAPSASLGANAFYSATYFLGSQDNPLDAEGATNTGQNDTLATAEALTESSTAGSYFVLAHLPTDGDVDYYKLTLQANTTLAIACGAQRNGSGIRGLTVSVRNDQDQEIRQGVESATEDLLIGGSQNPLNITAAGTYYVRLSKQSQAPDVTGTWIRCGIHSRAQQ